MSVPASVSLVIATYNWPTALAAVLASVRRQEQLPDEVLIADDGSGPETRALIVSEARDFPVPLIHVWHEDVGFRLAAIRNKAMARARSDYVIQVDGDILMDPRFVGDHVHFARRNQFVQGSRVLLDPTASARSIASRSIDASMFTPRLGNRINAVRLPSMAWLSRGSQRPLTGVRGCNMSFWRSDIVAVNGYDETFTGWGREDSELVIRLQRHGVTRRNLKFAAVAWHLHHVERKGDADGVNDARLAKRAAEGPARADVGLDRHRSTS